MNAIAENLFSLCDFSIISTFQDNTETGFQGELNILHEKSEGIRNKQEVALKTAPILKDYVEVVKGFTYRLKFNL